VHRRPHVSDRRFAAAPEDPQQCDLQFGEFEGFGQLLSGVRLQTTTVRLQV
jgi:hypothetical protein